MLKSKSVGIICCLLLTVYNCCKAEDKTVLYIYLDGSKKSDIIAKELTRDYSKYPMYERIKNRVHEQFDINFLDITEHGRRVLQYPAYSTSKNEIEYFPKGMGWDSTQPLSYFYYLWYLHNEEEVKLAIRHKKTRLAYEKHIRESIIHNLKELYYLQSNPRYAQSIMIFPEDCYDSIYYEPKHVLPHNITEQLNNIQPRHKVNGEWILFWCEDWIGNYTVGEP